MAYDSLYMRLAVPGGFGARTIVTKTIETVDNDETPPTIASALSPQARMHITEAKETLDDDAESLVVGPLLPPSPVMADAWRRLFPVASPG